jgi:hypothetical protein
MRRVLPLLCAVLALVACATPPDTAPPVTVATDRPNAVAYWNDIANRTVLATSALNTTPEERTPAFFFDLASVHVAIYDAVVAIEGRYRPRLCKNVNEIRPPRSMR